MAPRYHNVVVVGGSISGLMAGLVLNDTGCNVTILERIPEDAFIGQGSGLGIRPEVGEFIEKYKSKDIAIDHFEGHDTIVLNKDGTVAGEAPWPKNMFSTSWTSLAMALRKSLPNGVKFSSEVTHITETGDKIKVEYRHGDQTESIDNVDLVIGADGANSTVRKLMGITIPRDYLGYCLWRGSATISELQPETSKMFQSNKNFWSVYNRSNMLLYRTGVDKVMWGIYRLHTEQELKDILLDSEGHQHAITLTHGIRPEVLASIKEWSKNHFPSRLHECVEQADTAIIQAMTETVSPSNIFLNGKVLLVGEASALPRPHVAAGTGHAAYHASRLRDLAEGTITSEEWARNTTAFSKVLIDASEEQGQIWTKMDGNFEVVTASRAAMVEMMKKLAAVGQDVHKVDH